MKGLSENYLSKNSLIQVGLIWLGLSTLAFGQAGTFDSTSDGSDGPLVVTGALAPAADFSAVYDSARNEVLAFGGQNYSPSYKIDHTYTFDGTSWTRERPDLSPSLRESAAICYDSVRQKVVLYGGNSGKKDCWLWDGSSWIETVSPDPDTMFTQFDMAFDTGRGETLLVVRRTFVSAELETWGFDGSTWTQKTPATAIPAKNSISLVYDETLQKMVLLMRVDSSTFQTWTWDGTDWTQVITDAVDLDPGSGELVYDGRTNTTIFLDYQSAFSFTGSNWIPLLNVPDEFILGEAKFVYDSGLNALLRLNGNSRIASGGVVERNETWAWYANGSTQLLTSGSYTFDMSTKPDGIWNFTTIDIGSNVLVDFKNNTANTPVRWLASGSVKIEGTLDLSGKKRTEADLYPYPAGLAGIPGPGGYEGATAGPVGANMKVPGSGPGNGLYTGTTTSANGSFTTYSNPWIFPLTGGSGAGNVSSFNGGGAGGGALLIASSDTIIVHGQILSQGGTQNSISSGVGSSGAVLLQANTISGTGSITAGRIRLEAWERDLSKLILSAASSNYLTNGPPVRPVELGQNPPRLWVNTINGIPVANPRLSADSQLNADAYISGSGLTAIVV